MVVTGPAGGADWTRAEYVGVTHVSEKVMSRHYAALSAGTWIRWSAAVVRVCGSAPRGTIRRATATAHAAGQVRGDRVPHLCTSAPA